MCMPLRPGRSYRISYSSRTRRLSSKEKLQEYMRENIYHVWYERGGELNDYDGCEHNLYMILAEDSTEVRKYPYIKEGAKQYLPNAIFYKVNAPCMDAVFYFTIEE